MDNLDPLPTIDIRVHHLDAALADVRLRFADLPAGIDVRGRLMGPRCAGISTIEIAHYLKPVAGTAGEFQVLIPEPSFWTEARPNLYEGRLEFYWKGEIIGRKAISLGLHMGAGPRLHTVNA